MEKDTKVFNLNLPTYLYEDFFRMFPERGIRTAVLRKVVGMLVSKGREEPLTAKKILATLEGEEE